MNQYQLDLFKPDNKSVKLNSMPELNKDSSCESKLCEAITKPPVIEKLFNYSLGNKDNSFLLTYIDYECPQAFIADNIVTNALKIDYSKKTK
ncbi:hypothetical protein J7L67_05595 [bacterium]|nr:hypothetical protein [bacterium]